MRNSEYTAQARELRVWTTFALILRELAHVIENNEEISNV
jgi:hypothetical protein